MFNELIKQIKNLESKDGNSVVGISGFAGSGKSTLASKLADALGVNEKQIIRIDDLYVPLPRGSGMFDEYDWDLLRQIISDYKTGKDVSFVSHSFEGKESETAFARPPLLIVEGVKLFRKELMPYFDLSIWIDCPLDFAIGRAKTRDLNQGHDKEYMKRWDTEWLPQSREYFDTFRPDLLASFLYSDYK